MHSNHHRRAVYRQVLRTQSVITNYVTMMQFVIANSRILTLVIKTTNETVRSIQEGPIREGACGVSRGKQFNFMANDGERPGQRIYHSLDATVARRRNGKPRW